MKMMDKRVLVSMPGKLYSNLAKLAKKDYMSIAAYIRQAVVEKMEDEISPEEQKMIDEARDEYRNGKGVNWSKIKREHN
ncbi:MAG: hypothetical protein ABII88_06820 [Candidatus Omnitrophota bacterium]